MESSKVISTDKATVVIEVNPQVTQDTVICDDGQQARGAYHNTALKGFFKAQPKALGTVQIMIGVVVFLFGILRTNYDYYPSISIICGITYWGSLFYISTGSLSVAAQNKLHPCVVKASLGMNVISAITAATAIILMGIEIHLISKPYRRCSYSYDHTDSDICSNFKRYDMGITGLLLVFSILQFIISIFISGFACKATSNTDSTVRKVAINRNFVAPPSSQSPHTQRYIENYQTSTNLIPDNTSQRMETSKVISTDKATVVIQVHPQEAKDTVIFVDGQEARGTKHNTLTGFFKAQPKALGIVQILIGVMVFLIGIVLTTTINYSTIVIISGITYWGSFIYISAGSLSVAAQKKLNLCLVKASLWMNVVSAVTAGIAILLMGIQLGVMSTNYPTESFIVRTVGAMLVFTIPQFIISICISAFACKATCNIHSTVVNVALN